MSNQSLFPGAGPLVSKKFKYSFKHSEEAYSKMTESFRSSQSAYRDMHSNLGKTLSLVTKGLQTSNEKISLSLSALDFSKLQLNLGEQVFPILEISRKNQELLRNFTKAYEWKAPTVDVSTLSIFNATLISLFADENIRNIDFSGVEELTDDGSLALELRGNATSSSSTEVTPTVGNPKKKLIDMTEEDLTRIVKNSIGTAGTFSLAAFLYNLYSDYVNDAVKVIFEVVFAFTFTVMTGQYNEEVKTAIINTVQETSAVTDLRRVITKYVKANPIDQVAFLRKETFLRNGASKNAPIEIKEKISVKTVLTIVERKGNWLKVEIDSGDFAGEVGWVEESKVIKFKKVN